MDRTSGHRPLAYSSLSGCLWVIIPRWAYSPASCEVLFEVYYFLVHVLDALHWRLWDLMGSQEVKEESVSTTVASGTRLRKRLMHLSEMSDQVGGILGGKASFSTPKRDHVSRWK